jgi:kynurenine formamidase
LNKGKKNYGASTDITKSKVIEAAGRVRTGRIISLSQIYENGMPTMDFHGPYFQYTYRSPDYTLRSFGSFNNKLGSMICRYELSDHTGTHVDGLNHASRDKILYGGSNVYDIEASSGTTELGIENMPPVFTRGVLFNFPEYFGVDILEPSQELKPADFEGILKIKKMKIEPGDALLIYTGYSKLWMKENARYMDLQPGPGKRAAQWIAGKKVGITGADTASFDVVTPGTKELFPCHQVLITDHGIQLVENMKLDELALSGIDEFLFVMSPLKLKGGAGSPVAPFAVL